MEQKNQVIQMETNNQETQNSPSGILPTHQQAVNQSTLTSSNEVHQTNKGKNRKKRLFFIVGIPCGIAIAFGGTKLWEYYSLVNERIQSSKSSINQNQESGIYAINGQTSVTIGSKSIANYIFSKLNDNEGYYDYSDERSVTLSTAEYKRLEGLYNLRHYILFDFTFSDGKLKTRKILNKETKEDLGDVNKIDWKLVVGEDNLLYLSNYTIGEEFELDDNEGIYNDTNKSHTIIIIDSRGKENERKLGKGKIYVNDDFRNVTIKVK